jgi:hypothetical protein
LNLFSHQTSAKANSAKSVMEQVWGEIKKAIRLAKATLQGGDGI